MFLCVQSFLIFTCIYAQSFLTTLNHIKLFMLASAIFAFFAWCLFAAYFDIKESKIEEKIIDEKTFTLEMDNELQTIETEGTSPTF